MAEKDDTAAGVRSSPRILKPPPSIDGPLSPPRRQTKPKRAPSITPRKFEAFFARRSRRTGAAASSNSIGETARALGAITGSAINRRQGRPAKVSPIPLKPFRNAGGDLEDENETPRQAKRRKTGHHTPPESSPLKPPPLFNSSSPCSRLSYHPTPTPALLLSPLQSLAPSSQVTEDMTDSECDQSDLGDHSDLDDSPPSPPPRLNPLTRRGMSAHLLQRQLGSMPHAGRSFLPTPTSDWRSETANFASGPRDVHFCSSHEGQQRCIPFCAAACNTNSLVAIGDEEGRVRLLDSSSAARFDKIHLCFQAHSNAIIDLAFSEDDSRLATASGDQTGKVVDVMTRTPISVLSQHTASVKQVRFQPGRGQGHVLATSSRDGSIQIWDLRCHGGGPVMDSIVMERHSGLQYAAPRQLSSGCVVNSFFGAHEAMPRHQTRSLGIASSLTGGTTANHHPDIASRGEVPDRVSGVSVTAIHWLPAGREHLLLSACEADASIKLWDIRSIHTSRKHGPPTPLSYTAPPTSHTSWRHFGISSLSLSTDTARLYALCKDNTVYAYSTSHMVLGPTPGSTAGLASRKPKYAPADEIPAPMYGFRHPSFHATSFYIKSAVRPLRDGRSELLAVGSADGRPVLFPTDEAYFKYKLEAGNNNDNNTGANDVNATFTNALAEKIPRKSDGVGAAIRARSGHLRINSLAAGGGVGVRGQGKDDIPIIRAANDDSYGTPLVRGHDKEVGAITWTSEGKLVTVGDDWLIRCWGEDEEDGDRRGERARDLRMGGESEGRRWGCGWADVGEGWDEDEEDW